MEEVRSRTLADLESVIYGCREYQPSPTNTPHEGMPEALWQKVIRHLLAQGNDVSEPGFQEDWLAILELGLLGNTAQVQGRKEVRVDEFLRVLDEASASVLELGGRTADTMSLFSP